jgi:hypothetical protein
VVVVLECAFDLGCHAVDLHPHHEAGGRAAGGHAVAVLDGVSDDLGQPLGRFGRVRLVLRFDSRATAA